LDLGDLIRGRRWRKLVALLEHLPADSATVATRAGRRPGETWTRAEYLLAAAVDVLAVANWQRQGKKGAPRPKPLPRPGLETGDQHLGGEAMAPEEIDAILASRYVAEEVDE
jgi:hypothetical protein